MCNFCNDCCWLAAVYVCNNTRNWFKPFRSRVDDSHLSLILYFSYSVWFDFKDIWKCCYCRIFIIFVNILKQLLDDLQFNFSKKRQLLMFFSNNLCKWSWGICELWWMLPAREMKNTFTHKNGFTLSLRKRNSKQNFANFNIFLMLLFLQRQ
jgi:hypothetical protein